MSENNEKCLLQFPNAQDDEQQIYAIYSYPFQNLTKVYNIDRHFQV